MKKKNSLLIKKRDTAPMFVQWSAPYIVIHTLWSSTSHARIYRQFSEVKLLPTAARYVHILWGASDGIWWCRKRGRAVGSMIPNEKLRRGKGVLGPLHKLRLWAINIAWAHFLSDVLSCAHVNTDSLLKSFSLNVCR